MLSPCPTFRPEQMEWKHHVKAFEEASTDDPVLAAQRIQADDGMSTGILYQRKISPFQPGGRVPVAEVGLFEAEFEL